MQESVFIFADGEHDDAPGFQALLDGKPVKLPEGIAVRNGYVIAHHARLRFDSPLRLGEDSLHGSFAACSGIPEIIAEDGRAIETRGLCVVF